ncbi:mechanosensitive ion channel family protein [Antarctobacter jejuensis]|uniref:mechanosensitive ion channel family protein n=1 Tax=Antarctobacter jejuensis TaxID=1439938 RepID=UPI003FD383DF
MHRLTKSRPAPLLLGLCLLLLAAIAPLSAQAQSDDAPWFEVDSLNSGLGPAPASIDRSTPRATMESLLRIPTDGPVSASRAHLLDLSDIPPEDQTTRGAFLAEQLVSVIHRRAVLDWGQILDRPDALDARQTSNSATAGMKRRSLLVWEIELDGIPAAIRLNRIKPAGGDPVWVVSRQTVQKIPALYDAYGPSGYEEHLPDVLRQTAFWRLMWWEVIGLPLLALLAALAGQGTAVALRRVGRHATRRITTAAFRAARMPLVLVAVALTLAVGTQTIFVFSGRLNSVLTPLIAAGFVTAALMLIVNVIEVILDQITGFDEMDLTRQQFDEARTRATRIAALRRILVIIVFLFGFGIVLASANLFRTYGFSLLASAGVLTLILGYAARTILTNILASLQIALNQSARIGDRVVYKEALCHVERINFTYVQLRDWDGTRLVVPVSEFASTTFENWTLKEPEMLRVLRFKLAPDTDIDKMRAVFEEVLDELDQAELDDREKSAVRVTGQDAFGIDVWFMVPCRDPNTSWDVACLAREALLSRLSRMEEEEEVTLFPQASLAAEAVSPDPAAA